MDDEREHGHRDRIDVIVRPDPVVAEVLGHIFHTLHSIIERLNQMPTQDDIDALATQLNAAVDTLTTETTQLGDALVAIQAEIAALGTANPALDLTALTAAVGSASSAASAIQAAADAVEAIPPAPGP